MINAIRPELQQPGQAPLGGQPTVMGGNPFLNTRPAVAGQGDMGAGAGQIARPAAPMDPRLNMAPAVAGQGETPFRGVAR